MKDFTKVLPNKVEDTDESYHLKITEEEGVVITSQEYSGFFRALMSLAFLLDSPKGENEFHYLIRHAPLDI